MSSTEMVVNYKFVEIWNFDIMLEFIQIYLEKKEIYCATQFLEITVELVSPLEIDF